MVVMFAGFLQLYAPLTAICIFLFYYSFFFC